MIKLDDFGVQKWVHFWGRLKWTLTWGFAARNVAKNETKNGLPNPDLDRKWGVQMGIQVGERGSKRVNFDHRNLVSNITISSLTCSERVNKPYEPPPP